MKVGDVGDCRFCVGLAGLAYLWGVQCWGFFFFFFLGGGGGGCRVLLREDASGLEFSPFQLVPVLASSKLRQVYLVNLMSVSVQLHILGTQSNKPYIAVVPVVLCYLGFRRLGCVYRVPLNFKLQSRTMRMNGTRERKTSLGTSSRGC